MDANALHYNYIKSGHNYNKCDKLTSVHFTWHSTQCCDQSVEQSSILRSRCFCLRCSHRMPLMKCFIEHLTASIDLQPKPDSTNQKIQTPPQQDIQLFQNKLHEIISSPRTKPDWNQLPDSVVPAPNPGFFIRDSYCNFNIICTSEGLS